MMEVGKWEGETKTTWSRWVGCGGSGIMRGHPHLNYKVGMKPMQQTGITKSFFM